MKQRSRIGGGLALLVIAVGQQVWAAEDVQNMGEITVTGTREAVPLAETPQAVGVLKKEAIKLTAPTHPQQLLGQIPGVAVNVTNGEGHTTGIRQKIGTDPVYLYLEDGIPVRATGFFNHNALYEVNIPAAGGVEVVKGIGSALYGSDAIGGTINILTRAPSDKREFGISGELGSYGWRRVLGEANSGLTEKGALRADVNSSHTDGWRVKTAYDRLSANLRWDYAVGDAGMLKTILGYTKIDQQTGANSALTPFEYANTPTVNARSVAYRKVDALRLSTNYDRELDANTLLSVTPYFRHNYMNLNGSYNFAGDARIEKTDVNSLGVLLKWRKDYESAMRPRVIAGLDLDYSPGKRTEDALNFAGCTVAGTATSSQQYNCYAVGPRIYDYSVAYKSISPYVHSEFSPADKLRVTAGLRFDVMSYDMSNNLGNLPGDLPIAGVGTRKYYQIANTSRSFSRASPKLGLSYAISPDTHLHLSYNQGFRAPSESNLFRAGSGTNATAKGIAQAALDLKPIRSEQYELGVRGKAAGWDYDLTGYLLKKYDDLLSQRDPTNSFTMSTNNGSTSHRGVELGLGRALNERWQLDVAYSYAHHTYDNWVTNAANLSGKNVESAPSLLANTRLTWKPMAGATAQLEWVKMGAYWLDPANTGSYDGHELWNLRASHEFASGMTFSARAMNLLNKRYADSAAGTGAAPTLSPGLPRTFFVSVEGKW